MTQTRKKPIYVVTGDALSCIGEDRILNYDAEPEGDSLLDELQCPVADEVFIALRKSFTVSYPKNPFVDGLTEALHEIRKVCVGALIEMPEVLQDLQLAPIPPVLGDKRVGKTMCFLFAFTRSADLRIKIKYKKRTRSLLRILDPAPADDLIWTAREIVTLTFSEMHSEDQHEEVLLQIRNKIWNVLPKFNEYLTAMEAEPIAAKIEPNLETGQ